MPIDIESVQEVLSKLDGLAFSVIGGTAMALHGMDRSTNDLDILVAQEDLHEAASRLGGNLSPIANEGMFGYGVKLPNGLQVDLMTYPDEDEKVGEMLGSTSQGRMSKPWLLISKIRSGREKDIEDASLILQSMDSRERKMTRRILRDNFPSLMDDYEMVLMGQELAMAWVKKNCKFAKSIRT
jgi:hypothetical protein